jgi:hypothetical protein
MALWHTSVGNSTLRCDIASYLTVAAVFNMQLLHWLQGIRRHMSRSNLLIARFSSGQFKRNLRRKLSMPEHLEPRFMLTIDPLTTVDPAFFGNTGNGASNIPSLSADGNIVVFQSTASDLLPGVTLPNQIYAYNRTTNSSTLVTVNDVGGGPSQFGGSAPAVSANGQFVVFISTSKDLVSQNVGSDLNLDQLYIRDMIHGTTTLVSEAPNGIAGGNFDSGGDSSALQSRPALYSISENGRYVAFWSQATNLISPAPANKNQLYVRDLQTSTTRLASTNSSGAAAGPSDLSENPFSSLSVTNDGSILFATTIGSLVNGDTNGLSDVFINDGTTKLVSRNVTNTGAGDDDSNAATWNSDYSKVYFLSTATNLTTGGSNGKQQLYVRDLTTGTTTLVTHAIGAPTQASDGDTVNFTISLDGRYVSLESSASDLVSVSTNLSANVFLIDTNGNNSTALISTGTGGDGAFGNSGFPVISGDGTKIVFKSNAPNLIDGYVSNSNASPDYFVYDRLAGTTTLLDADRINPLLGGNGTEDFGESGGQVAISNDAAVIAFQALSSNLIENDNNLAADVFIKDASGTRSVSLHDASIPDSFLVGGYSWGVSTDGRYVLLVNTGSRLSSTSDASLYLKDTVTGDLTPINPGSTTTIFSARISPDGRFVVFSDGQVKIFDRTTGTLEVVSQTPDGSNSNGNFQSDVDVSSDGRYVTFAGNAPDLVAGLNDQNGTFIPDIYLRDRQLATTALVNRKQGTSSTTSNGGYGQHLQISANGATVVFDSIATDLTANNDPNGNTSLDTFTFNVATQLVSLVSVTVAGQAAGSHEFTVSADGQTVAFSSSGGNLVPAVFGDHVYVRNIQQSTTQLVDMNSANTGPTTGASRLPKITPDGRYVLFESEAGDLVVGYPNANSNTDVYVRDLQTHQTSLASVSTDGVTGGNGQSNLDENGGKGRTQISPNGRYIVFESRATNLTADFVDANGTSPDLFLRDQVAGTTQLVSRSTTGTGGNASTSANTFNWPEQFMALNDGRVIFFSYASNLVTAVDADVNYDTFLASPVVTGGAVIRGSVFSDLDSDGVRENDEPSLTGVKVYLDADHNGSHGPNEVEVTTGTDGSYSFGGLSTGTYRIRIDTNNSNQITSPGTGFHDVIIATNDQVQTDLDFADHILIPDLIVSGITVPSAAHSGLPLTISWTAKNQGDGPTSISSWKDRIYLSTSPALTSSSILIGSAMHIGALGTGGTYNGSLTLDAPAVTPGKYYVIVQVDGLYQVADADSSNNTLTAAGNQISFSVSELALGTSTTGSFATSSQDRYYKITVPDDGSLLVALTDSPASESNAIYVSYGRLPTIYQSDFQTSRSAGPDPRLAVPITLGGTYYVLIHNLSGVPGMFHVTASLEGLTLLDVSPQKVGNAGQATLTVNGLDLAPETRYSLVGPGGTIPAMTTLDASSSQAFVTFDLTGKATGTYTLHAMNSNGATTTLTDTILVTPGGGPNVIARILLDDPLRADKSAVFYVQYENVGNNDALAPLLTLTSPSLTPMSLDPTPTPSALNLQVLGLNLGGAITTLPPGATFQFPVYLRPSVGGKFEFDVYVTSALDTVDVLDADAWQEGILPAIPSEVRSADNWPAVETQLRQMIGATWGQYVAFLDRFALLMPANAGQPKDPADIISLAVDQALAAVGTSIRGVAVPTAPGVILLGNVVTATNSATAESFQANILNDGSFVFPTVTAGSYTFNVQNNLIHGSPAPVTVAAGQAVTGVTVTLDPQVVLTGNVTEAATGNPVAGAVIFVVSDGQIVANITTNARGAYAAIFPPGDYTIVVDAPGLTRSYSDATLTAGITTLTFPLTEESLLSGSVTSSDNQAVQSFDVIATLHGDQPLPMFTGNFTGTTFSLGSLPPGTYDVSISAAPDYLPLTMSNVQIGAGQTLNLGSLQLTPIDPVAPAVELILKSEAYFATLGMFSAKGAGSDAFQILNSYFGGVGTSTVAAVFGPNFGYVPSAVPNPSVTITDSADVQAFAKNEVTKTALEATLKMIGDVLQRKINANNLDDLPEIKAAMERLRGTSCSSDPIVVSGLKVEELMPNLGLQKWMDVTMEPSKRSPDDVLKMWNYATNGVSTLIAGGVGQGGAPPGNAVQSYDDRLLSGTIELTIPPNGKAELMGKFSVALHDTFDFDPAGLGHLFDNGTVEGGYNFNQYLAPFDLKRSSSEIAIDVLVQPLQFFADNVTAYGVLGLGELERIGLTADVPFNVTFSLNDVKSKFDVNTGMPNCPRPPGDPVRAQGTAVKSYDPNDLIGPAGYGPQGFIQPIDPFLYTVDFENVGSVAAQDVTVTQQLDSDLDWSTFQLGSFGWGSESISVPAGLTRFRTAVAYQNNDGTALNVQVDLNFDVTTGLLTATYVSLDPGTGASPSGVLDGFLYPEDGTGVGQGDISYIVRPKASLLTGTVISATASIVFDTNAAISTKPHINTIDSGSPSSAVGSLPATVSDGGFSISWSGTDDGSGPFGSGIGSFDIYASDNDGAFSLWKSEPGTTLSDLYPGVAGQIYAFYSIASDNVGHVESVSANADAQTAVVANHTPDVSDVLFSLPENSVNSTPVGTVTATDADTGDTLTYSITGDNVSGAFAINSATGVITVANKAALDFETTPTFTLIVQVQDSHGATDSASVTINLTDVNENPQLALGGTDVTWVKKQAPLIVLPQLAVGGTTNLIGGTLTVTMNAIGSKKKALDLLHIPPTAGLGTSSGLQYAGGHLTVTIQLGASATNASIQSFLRGITFATKGKGLSNFTRSLGVTLAAASGAKSSIAQTIHVRKKA